MARLVFLGSPQAAVPTLEALAAAGHDVVLVVSRPDTRRGRGAASSPSAVKAAAGALGLSVSDRLEDAVEVAAELGVVVAYGRIVPPAVLDRLAMVNVHFSLLPRWRGAAPVERAVLAGDAETGVCLMRLEAGLDTGPVLVSQSVPLEHGEHAGVLRTRLARVGAALVVDALSGGVDALPEGTPQQGVPTYAEKLTPEELRLDWRRPARELERVVCLDRAWTTAGGARLLVLDALALEAASADTAPDAASGAPLPGTVDLVDDRVTVQAGDGLLELRTVQRAGGRPTDAAAWWRGMRSGITLLGAEEGR